MKCSGGTVVIRLFCALCLCACLCCFGCGKKDAPEAVNDQYKVLLEELDADTVGKSIEKLQAFQAQYSRYKIADSAAEKIESLQNDSTDRYLAARDLARDGEFDRADTILKDLVEYFPTTSQGKNAAQYLEFEFPLMMADHLMMDKEFEKAETILRKLRAKKFSNEQSMVVEAKLDGITRSAQYASLGNDARAQSFGRKVKMMEEVYYNENSAYTPDLEQLRQVNKSISDEPGVTLNFLHASEQGFTFTTTHEKGTGSVFTFQN